VPPGPQRRVERIVPATQALMAFQRQQGFQASGRIDSQTVTALGLSLVLRIETVRIRVANVTQDDQFSDVQPFTAATLSGVKFKMTFTPDGKMTREPLAESGSKSAGTWRLNAQGFCTSWGREKASCFTVVPIGENRWSVKRLATTIAVAVAVWSK
jgi:hypothetical protein